MSFKNATSVDATEMMEKLSDIRKTVAEERAKRLAGSSTPNMIATFHSGQENAKSKKSKSTLNTQGFGNKHW